jgi:hypothetical protein
MRRELASPATNVREATTPMGTKQRLSRKYPIMRAFPSQNGWHV